MYVKNKKNIFYKAYRKNSSIYYLDFNIHDVNVESYNYDASPIK